MTAAARQRAYRARVRKGEALLRVRVGHPVIEALIVSTRLSEAEALDRRKVASAVADVVEEWAQHWL
jgi:hypothetical protein